MYATIYHSLVREGLVQGFRCPVSGKEFVTCNASKAEIEALFRKQQAFSSDLYYLQDHGTPILRSVESRRQQYVAEHGESL